MRLSRPETGIRTSPRAPRPATPGTAAQKTTKPDHWYTGFSSLRSLARFDRKVALWSFANYRNTISAMRKNTYGSFEEIRPLPIAQLRTLLKDGDASERIWAAWAYALRRGEGSVTDLAEIAQRAPTSGERRHLVIILAGHGESEVTRKFAEGDPDPLVRATACRLLLQAFFNRDADTRQFLLDVLRSDPAPAVRLAVLSNARMNGLEIPPDQLVERAGDADEEIRRQSLQAIAEDDLEVEAVGYGLACCLDTETKPELLERIAAICVAAGSANAVLRNAARQQPGIRLLLLDVLIGLGVRFDWPCLKDLVALTDDTLDARIAMLASEASRVPMLSWLVARVTAKMNEMEQISDDDPVWALFTDVIMVTKPCLTAETLEGLREIDRQVCETINELKCEVAAGLRLELGEHEYLYLESRLEHLVRLSAGIRYLIEDPEP